MKAATGVGDDTLAGIPDEPSELVRFDYGVLLRAVNTVKSAQLLLEHSHWEFAAGPVRGLFELVVNMEHLAAQDDRSAASLRFAKFGLLQTIRAQLREMAYQRETGRPVNEERRTTLEALLQSGFAEFQVGGPGSGKWASSWASKTTRALAEQSPYQPLREAQYSQLFVAWSEQVHGAPAALLPAMFPRSVNDIDEIVGDDDIRIAETGSMAITLFVTLWSLLPSLPALDRDVVRRWHTDLMAQARALGAPEPLSRYTAPDG